MEEALLRRAASGVPCSPLKSRGDLGQELQGNPPLPRHRPGREQGATRSEGTRRGSRVNLASLAVLPGSRAQVCGQLAPSGRKCL